MIPTDIAFYAIDLSIFGNIFPSRRRDGHAALAVSLRGSGFASDTRAEMKDIPRNGQSPGQFIEWQAMSRREKTPADEI